MNNITGKPHQSFSAQIYRLLLYCYPASFRRAYMPEMMQAFRDCQREALQQRGRRGLLHLWQAMLRDLVLTVSVEYGRVCLT